MTAIGDRFNRWLVLEQAQSRPGRKGTRWLVRCDCGTEKILPASRLKDGNSRGCAKCQVYGVSTKTHGLSNTRIFHLWTGMKDRCDNPKNQKFRYYGGRGIKVCPKWKNDFTAFYAWAVGNGYSDDLSIDRKNNDGDYDPGNCRWATVNQQARNRSNNVRFLYQNEMQVVPDIARKVGMSPSVLRGRLVVLGWTIEKSTTTPVLAKRRS